MRKLLGLLVACVWAASLGAADVPELLVVFTKTLVLSTLATLIPYAFCSLAVFIPGGGRAKNLSGGAATIA